MLPIPLRRAGRFGFFRSARTAALEAGDHGDNGFARPSAAGEEVEAVTEMGAPEPGRRRATLKDW
jgi:hypothetical protein